MRARLLKRRCYTLLRGLNARLSAIDTTEYPTDTAPATRDLLQRYLTHIEKKIQTTDDTSLLFLATELLDSLDHEIGYIELATTSSAPSTLSLMVEDIRSKLQLEGAFFVAPNAERNYMVENITSNLARLTNYYLDTNERDEIFGNPPQSIYVVSFPRTGRDDILTHSVLGHEIGHEIAFEFIKQDQLTKEFNDATESAVEIIREQVTADKNIPAEERLEQIEYRLDEVERARDRAIEELVSDIVGIFLFGPSALFALHEFLCNESPDMPPRPEEYYPPLRYRIRVGLTTLRAAGYRDALFTLPDHPVFNACREMIEYLEGVAKKHGDVETIHSDPLLRIAYDYVSDVLPRAMAFVEQKVAAAAYDPKDIAAEIPELVARLLASVPPNEVGIPPNNRPVDWRSSILGGWLCFHAASEVCDLELDAKRITELTMLAVEYTNIHSNFLSESGK